MRSIGVFQSSNSTPQVALSTIANESYYVNQRMMSRQNVQANQKPKVGTLDSSQRTYIRAASASADRTQMITPHASKNSNTVNSALNRVRNAGAVAPKKKGANKSNPNV